MTEREAAERSRFVAAALFLLTASFVVVRTARDSLYFAGSGLYDLPRAYLGITILAFPVAAIALSSMRRLGPRGARVVALLATAAMFAAFAPVARPGGGGVMTLFFMGVPLVYGILFSLTWLLTADLLDGAPPPARAPAYALVGAASIGGGMGGGAAARALAELLPPTGLLLVGAGLIVASVAIVMLAHARYPAHRLTPAAGPGASPESPSLRTVMKERGARWLLAVGMAASLVGLLVEFQFYVGAATSGRDASGNAQFFANLYLGLNTAALAVQLLVMPRLQRRLGVEKSLLVLPAALLGGAVLLLASASLGARAAVRAAEGGLKASIHRSNWEQAFVSLPRARRAIAKMVVDGIGARLAEGFAAALLWMWLTFVVAGAPLVGAPTDWLAWALLAAALSWFLLTRVLGRVLGPAMEGPPGEERVDIPLPET